MKNSIFSEQLSLLQSLMSEAGSLGIVVSENHNLDKMAAGLSLYLALKAAGKDIQIISKKDPIVEISNLVGINKVKKTFDGKAKTLVVSLPYRQGEIEKVSYNIEGDRININLFAPKDQGINFSEKDVEYIKTGAAPTTVITIGVKNIQEIQGLLGDQKSAHIIAIDTAASNSGFAQVSFADNNFSSCSEIVAMILEELRLPIDMDTAQNIMDGLTSATSNFTAPTASSYAFDAAGFALKNGARRRGGQRQNQQQRGQQNPQQMRQPHNIQRFQPQRAQVVEEVQPLDAMEELHQPEPMPQPVMKEEVAATEEPIENKEEDVPSDWFVPKVFKTSRNQGDN